MFVRGTTTSNELKTTQMASIKFFTRSKESNLVPVYIRFIDGRRCDIWLPTYYQVLPAYWDNKNQRFKKNMLYTKVFSEKKLLQLEKTFADLKDTILMKHLDLKCAPSKDWLKRVVNEFSRPGNVETENFNQYVERYVEEAKSGKRLTSNGNTKMKFRYGSLRVLQGFKLSWELFCEGKQYGFEEINIDTYNAFIDFFYDRNCGANYIGKHIKTWKTIMRKAREEGLHKNSDIELKAFKTLSEETDNIYLTEGELKAIFELDLSDSAVLKKVRPDMASNKQLRESRDVFLVGCYTAQRYSDYKRICKDMIKIINGIKFVEILQQKTGIKCLIPLRPEADKILKQYDYTLPKTLEQHVNRNIKDIGELAGITEIINREKNKGGKIVKTKVPKFKMIMTHTARRSGATNMFLAKIPTLQIMKITGHKSEREFLKYIKVSQEETAIILGTHSYFTGSPLKIAK